MIYANTTSKHSTHFIAGVELVKKAREFYKVSSENWPYPTMYKFGDPNDLLYYAEIWVDGMDWQHSYWIIESKVDDPQIFPLIIFEDHDEEYKFNKFDFGELVQCIMWFRRAKKCNLNIEHNYFSDQVLPYLNFISSKKRENFTMALTSYEHASQPRVQFFLNMEFYPK